MAWNPTLARSEQIPEGRHAAAVPSLFPEPLPGEKLLLVRKGVGVAIQLGEQKFSGRGMSFLTTRRLVFLKDGDLKTHKQFSSCEFPFSHVSGERGAEAPKFHQPVFGANYMRGNCAPKLDAEYPFPLNAIWSLTFYEGGCVAFLKAFYKVLSESPGTRAGEDVNLAEQVVGGMFRGNAAFVDPTDPSMLYTAQPQCAQSMQWNTQVQGYVLVPMVQGQPPPLGSVGVVAAQLAPAYAGPMPPGAIPLFPGQQLPPGAVPLFPGQPGGMPGGIPPGGIPRF